VLLGLGATVALPEEDNGLANKHSNGAGSQTSQNTQNSRDDNKAEYAGESASESAVMRRVVVAIVAVRGRRRAITHVSVTVVMVVVILLGEVLESREGWHTLREELVMILRSTVVASHTWQALVLAVAALTAALPGHAHNTFFGGGQETTNAVEQEFPKALGLAIALLPGEALGGRSGLLNLGLGDVELPSGGLDQSNGDGIDGNGVSLEVENGESYIKQIGSRGVIGRSQRHHLQGITDGHGLRGLAIFELLNGTDRLWGNGREDLTTVSQKAVVFNGEV
jgi:hypothetical protein